MCSPTLAVLARGERSPPPSPVGQYISATFLMTGAGATKKADRKTRKLCVPILYCALIRSRRRRGEWGESSFLLFGHGRAVVTRKGIYLIDLEKGLPQHVADTKYDVVCYRQPVFWCWTNSWASSLTPYTNYLNPSQPVFWCWTCTPSMSPLTSIFNSLHQFPKPNHY